MVVVVLLAVTVHAWCRNIVLQWNYFTRCYLNRFTTQRSNVVGVLVPVLFHVLADVTVVPELKADITHAIVFPACAGLFFARKFVDFLLLFTRFRSAVCIRSTAVGPASKVVREQNRTSTFLRLRRSDVLRIRRDPRVFIGPGSPCVALRQVEQSLLDVSIQEVVVLVLRRMVVVRVRRATMVVVTVARRLLLVVV